MYRCLLLFGVFAVLSFPFTGSVGLHCDKKNLCCKVGESCCLMRNGTHGCFPEDDAVCCPGSSFACMKGYVCHMQFGMCIDIDVVMPPISPVHAPSTCEGTEPGFPKVDAFAPCGPNASCAVNATCCPSAPPACCPLPNAVCCSDQQHCCPAGYTCDPSRQGCTAVSEAAEITSVFARPISEVSAGVVLCPDHTACMDDQTCCATKSGRFACCPYDGGVCCSDQEHCCPHSYKCDIVNQRCVRSLSWESFVKPVATRPSKEILEHESGKLHLAESAVVGQVICPDPNYRCTDNTTCCHLKSGVWGCCPYMNAVCCTDGDNCCPNGYTCDTIHQRCVSGPAVDTVKAVNEVKSDWLGRKIWGENSLEKLAIPFDTSRFKIGEVLCPDKSSVCDDGTTCCLMADGSYGCCPYMNATCCSDHQHCCPNGYTCDLVHQQCAQSSDVNAPRFLLIEAFVVADDDNSDKVREQSTNTASENAAFPFLQDIMSVIERVVDIRQISESVATPDSEGQVDVVSPSTCSALESLAIGCPSGTSCCHPPGEGQSAVCCPGSGPVACCPGGFCCPEEHECHPVSLTCHKTGDAVRQRAIPGFYPGN